MKKALLVNPPTGRYFRSERCQTLLDTHVADSPRPPMDLALIAAVLEGAGWSCTIRDYPMENLSWADVKRELSLFRPDLLLISTTTPTIIDDLALCAMAKELNPAVLTVAKGAHFYEYDAEILHRFVALDIAVRGEAEVTIGEIAAGRDLRLVNGISFRRDHEVVRTPERAFIEDLDSLPLPARHLVNNNLYRTPDTDKPIAFITTARGCPGRCVFCLAGRIGGRAIRFRSVASVLLEVEDCIRRFGITEFYFTADTFTWDRAWVVSFCREIVDRKLALRWGTNSRVDTIDDERLAWMKKAGCYVLGFGAESASQEMLTKMEKGVTVAQIGQAVALCERHRIKSFLHLMIGLPWETRETIEATIRFVERTRAAFVDVAIAYPLPGTQYYEFAKREGLFREEDLPGHDHTAAMVRTFTLTTQELRAARKRILRAFYLRPSYLLRALAELRSPRVAIRYFRHGALLLRNLVRT